MASGTCCIILESKQLPYVNMSRNSYHHHVWLHILSWREPGELVLSSACDQILVFFLKHHPKESLVQKNGRPPLVESLVWWFLIFWDFIKTICITLNKSLLWSWYYLHFHRWRNWGSELVTYQMTRSWLVARAGFEFWSVWQVSSWCFLWDMFGVKFRENIKSIKYCPHHQESLYSPEWNKTCK